MIAFIGYCGAFLARGKITVQTYPTDEVKSAVDSASGQEQVSVGVCDCVGPDDWGGGISLTAGNVRHAEDALVRGRHPNTIWAQPGCLI